MKSELLSHLVSNPEAVETIMHVVSNAIEAHGNTTSISTQAIQGDTSMQYRIQLLEALKPHLSNAACKKIDHAMQLCELARDVKASLTPATDH